MRAKSVFGCTVRASHLAVALFLCAGNNCALAICEWNVWTYNTVIRVNGENIPVQVPLPVDEPAIVHLAFDPWTGTPTGCSCNDGHVTCEGAAYNHVHFQHSWPLSVQTNGVVYTVSWAEIDAYWDWEFQGYTKTGTANYDENCYGYAFDTNAFIEDGQYGAGVIVSDCYEQEAQLRLATIAYNDGSHAIKIAGTNCDYGETSQDELTWTSEKFRDSAYYSLSGGCWGQFVDYKPHLDVVENDGTLHPLGPYVQYKRRSSP